MISTYMPPSREVENDGCRPERHEQVELGSENDDPDALERPLDRPSRVPGGSHGGPQSTVGHLRAVDLETAHLDLRSIHPLSLRQRPQVGKIAVAVSDIHRKGGICGNKMNQVSFHLSEMMLEIPTPVCCSSNLLAS